MKKVSINFTDEEYQILSELLVLAKGRDKNITMSFLIKSYLYLYVIKTEFDYPEPVISSPKERGQGRKKKNNNINTKSEQDMFRVNLNSLAPCVGVNSDAE